ncbi:MAG: hypothetical protein AMK69_11055 [Nitrospira bacterium SG8_3]|nr:MAG: hypothetical protein AMK69_11055 [Nitrospira bacterium SG8_3]
MIEHITSIEGAGEVEKITGPYYYTEGSVRGRCHHKHRTFAGAILCLQRDQAGCKQQGGYSDRGIFLGGVEITIWPEGYERR